MSVTTGHFDTGAKYRIMFRLVPSVQYQAWLGFAIIALDEGFSLLAQTFPSHISCYWEAFKRNFSQIHSQVSANLNLLHEWTR